MRRRTPLCLLPIALLAAIGAACGEARPERPNIVLLVSDDQDYEHLGFLTGTFDHMPNVDALAESGLVFTNAHAQPRCRPSLACLLSGQWPHQSGVYANRVPAPLSPVDSLPNLLRSAGYATFAGGKYWEEEAGAMGFDAPEEPTRHFVRSGQDELFAFIDEHAGRRPLFVWWAPALPHTPHDPSPELLARIDRAAIPIPEWFEQNKDIYRDLEREVLAMEAWFDDGVGELRQALERAGILDDTLFVFLIDNGWSNGLLSKGSPYEKGVRTPIVFTWPGRIEPGRNEELVASVDVYATLLEYAGVPQPNRRAGRSLAPLIAGDPDARGRERLFGAVYPRYGSEAGRPEQDAFALYARDRRWKYVRFLQDVPAPFWDITRARPQGRLVRDQGEEELFDLAADPYERVDLSSDPAQAERLAELRGAAMGWWRSTGGGPLAID